MHRLRFPYFTAERLSIIQSVDFNVRRLSSRNVVQNVRCSPIHNLMICTLYSVLCTQVLLINWIMVVPLLVLTRYGHSVSLSRRNKEQQVELGTGGYVYVDVCSFGFRVWL